LRDGSRARELLPSVLLTLLSVVQALALEALWSAVHESPWLGLGGQRAWVGWLQSAAIFEGIVVIWLLYIGIVMRFTWVPATRDSVVPFVIGAGELCMISMMEPGLLDWWFWVLAAVFVVSARVSNAMFQSGMADPQNDKIVVLASNPLERWASSIAAGIIAVCGVGVRVWGEDGAFAIFGLLVANALLIGQGLLIHHYWRQWVGEYETP
jgi:hypothetical protein